MAKKKIVSNDTAPAFPAGTPKMAVHEAPKAEPKKRGPAPAAKPPSFGNFFPGHSPRGGVAL